MADGVGGGGRSSFYQVLTLFFALSLCLGVCFVPAAAQYAHYDNKPNFSDWVPFGGWKTPLIKQFNNGPPVCGVSMDHNFIPL